MAQRTSVVIPERFTADVLAWGVPRLRDLPWRRTRDPWAVLVSEVMLQQTQVARVVPRWHAFLERFPDVGACARAPRGDVLREWQGLGYPRRARNLHAVASRVADAGAFPADLAGLLALPGIGPYTARAVLAFAFESDAAVVDTNIARVYARVVGSRLTPQQVQSLADEACPSGDAWVWNQCLMDLGALLCRPRAPRCGECPVRSECSWHGTESEPDPAVGSSGVSGRQARFEGSDRQARGRLLRALSDGAVERTEVAAIMQRDEETAERLIAALAGEGLCLDEGRRITLPG
ncbi:MAG: A/G-specific adenine glycosylase [Ilumatobacteraceae bacterium]